ncbi:hypothetical protein Sinac_1813 [Singulisphaera acidiphila DSM 18658]|uniref:Uncharacterized protein n=1 Tax=Singulisphaera acidiphila (strain ATCC BAA-1392 / DSM 18658 / VKM B-2454 / MOB10) TaxID=886293 RepID=L0D9W0_SINAD|nr:hypothetical protein Sinac_1813 [Singulisphaera acidiphila DSM 18658]
MPQPAYRIQDGPMLPMAELLREAYAWIKTQKRAD